MIKILARFFRGVQLIFGVSAPPWDQNERTFVVIWLGSRPSWWLSAWS